MRATVSQTCGLTGMLVCDGQETVLICPTIFLSSPNLTDECLEVVTYVGPEISQPSHFRALRTCSDTGSRLH